MESERPRTVLTERIDCETGEVTVVTERLAAPAWRVEHYRFPRIFDVLIRNERGDTVLRATNRDSLLSFLAGAMQDCERLRQRLRDLEEIAQQPNDESASQKSELAALRQIVADMETCRGVGVENGVTICGAAEIALVALTWPALHDDRAFEASTWQAALHAAAEHVRREQTT